MLGAIDSIPGGPELLKRQTTSLLQKDYREQFSSMQALGTSYYPWTGPDCQISQGHGALPDIYKISCNMYFCTNIHAQWARARCLD